MAARFHPVSVSAPSDTKHWRLHKRDFSDILSESKHGGVSTLQEPGSTSAYDTIRHQSIQQSVHFHKRSAESQPQASRSALERTQRSSRAAGGDGGQEEQWHAEQLTQSCQNIDVNVFINE